jgi:hypothetical protein
MQGARFPSAVRKEAMGRDGNSKGSSLGLHVEARRGMDAKVQNWQIRFGADDVGIYLVEHRAGPYLETRRNESRLYGSFDFECSCRLNGALPESPLITRLPPPPELFGTSHTTTTSRAVANWLEPHCLDCFEPKFNDSVLGRMEHVRSCHQAPNASAEHSAVEAVPRRSSQISDSSTTLRIPHFCTRRYSIQ